MLKITAPKEISLLEALALLSPQSSKTTLREWVQEGRVAVDGRILRKANTQVLAGQIVSIGPKVKYVEGDLRVLYEDKDIVVIDKPEGLLSVATDFEQGETAQALLKKYYRSRKIHVVHRLDQETSGVMLFVFNEKAQDKFKDMFAAHRLQREYVAIVEGALEDQEGTWESYLFEDDFYKVHSTKDESKGRKAITHFELLNKTRAYSRLKLVLETGRKNQIRVHCQEAGYPVVGDKKYGAHGNPIKRLALHAHLLAFEHPITGKKMKFTSPVPEVFDRLVKPLS